MAGRGIAGMALRPRASIRRLNCRGQDKSGRGSGRRLVAFWSGLGRTERTRNRDGGRVCSAAKPTSLSSPRNLSLKSQAWLGTGTCGRVLEREKRPPLPRRAAGREL
jgi:hypothetical protein